MRRSVIIILACLFSSFGFLPFAYSLPWPPTITVYSIGFNYESGYSNDALTIKKGRGSTMPTPEWLTGGVRNERFAYIKSQSSRKVRVQFYIEPSDYRNSNIRVYAEVSVGGIGYISRNTVYFQGSQYSTPKVMTCQGSVAGSVAISSFSWSWYADAVNGSPLEDPLVIGTTGDHTYYILLAAPQAPMSEPWTDVLDYACIWASGKTNEGQAVVSITTNAYTNFGKNYYGGGTHAPGTTFHLTSLLASSWADCHDMSATVHVFTKAIGGTQTNVRMINDPDPYVENFKYKPIDPVGDPSWKTDWWNFHQVANYSGVYDACLMLNQSNPRIPTGEDIDGSYKTDLFDPVSGSVWKPKNPFSYTTVD